MEFSIAVKTESFAVTPLAEPPLLVKSIITDGSIWVVAKPVLDQSAVLELGIV